jgi:hypothetical protein
MVDDEAAIVLKFRASRQRNLDKARAWVGEMMATPSGCIALAQMVVVVQAGMFALLTEEEVDKVSALALVGLSTVLEANYEKGKSDGPG